MTDHRAQLEHFFVARHLQRMTDIVAELGDDLAAVVPDLPGANSAYAIVVHCCGMLEWWTRAGILGLSVDRDRDAEFVARGTVAELRERVQRVTTQLSADLADIDPNAPLRGDAGDYTGTPVGADARGALLHILEELAQHHGQLELTRDIVRRG